MNNWIHFSPLVIAVTLAGCAVGPDYQMPSTFLPSEYLPQVREKVTRSAEASSADLTQWWRVLHDRELNSLVARARESNLDLAIALDRLQQARTGVTIAVSQGLPVVGATGGGGVGTGSDETKGRVSQALRSATNAQGLQSINEAGGLDASWELDLFRKIPAADRGADRRRRGSQRCSRLGARHGRGRCCSVLSTHARTAATIGGPSPEH